MSNAPKEGLVFVDTHADFHLQFWKKIESQKLAVINPAFFGYFATNYSLNNPVEKIAWLETHETRRYGNKRLAPKWDHPKKASECNAKRAHIDLDGVAQWDEMLKQNIAFTGIYGTVPLEETFHLAKNVDALAIVEELHGCKNRAYVDFCLSKEAFESALKLNTEYAKKFQADVVYFAIDKTEVKLCYKDEEKQIMKTFENLVDNLPMTSKLRFITQSSNIEEFAARQLDLYKEVQRDMQNKKVMLVSNTHAAAWLIDPWQTSFSECPKQIRHYVSD